MITFTHDDNCLNGVCSTFLSQINAAYMLVKKEATKCLIIIII